MREDHDVTNTPSMFMIGDLALRSAVQVERLRRRETFDRAPLLRLADALEGATVDAEAAGTFSFLRPGFVEPFTRVYSYRNSNLPKTSQQLQEFVDEAARRLRKLTDEAPELVFLVESNGDALTELKKLCLNIHAELIRSPAAGSARESRGGDIKASARVG